MFTKQRQSPDQALAADRRRSVPDDGSYAIRTVGLGRTFAERTAVDGLDLAIEPGEIYGFLGPNGAGKSTTVRMLCTLLTPSFGSASVAGFDVATQPGQVRRHIGAALQEAALDPLQTGEELLGLQGRLYGLTTRRAQARIEELAAVIDIGDALRRPVSTYSGGMKRRLDLAVALVHHPAVLFLDEPTTGLDPASRATVWDEVRRLNRQLGLTIFLTTPYLVGVGSDVIVARVVGDLAEAKRVLQGIDGVGDVTAAHGELLVEVSDGAAAIGPAAIALGHAGIAIQGLTLRTTTLDDVFLEVTGQRILPTQNATHHTNGTNQ